MKIKKLVPQTAKNQLHLLQAQTAHFKYRFPARKIKIIGVTGTDGKTTTANLIYHLLKHCGKKVALISTINAMIGKEVFDTGFHVTTPDPQKVPQYIAKAVKAGCEYLVLEVTSHALDQNRVAGIKYVAGVVTNITPEHLDYHKTYQSYLKAKAKLLQRSRIAIINADDQSYSHLQKILKKQPKKPVLTYGIQKSADVMAVNPKVQNTGSQFEISYDQTNLLNIVEHKKMTKKKEYREKINSPLPGEYNVSNVLAAVSVCLALEQSFTKLVEAISSFKPLVGRMEEIEINKPYKVIVDFAHTPNAFARALPVLKEMAGKNHGRLIHIFGCAGLRDNKKRPEMGKISGQYADITIVTAEDPRTEDLDAINAQILEGYKQNQKKEISLDDKQEQLGYLIVKDRFEAINTAMTKIAKKGDIIAITGKGHEQSMCFGTTETPWSDQKAVKQIINGK